MRPTTATGVKGSVELPLHPNLTRYATMPRLERVDYRGAQGLNSKGSARGHARRLTNYTITDLPNGDQTHARMSTVESAAPSTALEETSIAPSPRGLIRANSAIRISAAGNSEGRGDSLGSPDFSVQRRADQGGSRPHATRHSRSRSGTPGRKHRPSAMPTKEAGLVLPPTKRTGTSDGLAGVGPPLKRQRGAPATSAACGSMGTGPNVTSPNPFLPSPTDVVVLTREGRVATPSDLFDMARRNIRLGETCYTCSVITAKGKPTREIVKVYLCSMVSTPTGWVSRPSFREPKGGSPKASKKCRGKIAGHFRCNSFYFRPHGTVGHACQLRHSGRRSDPDIRPPLMTITAPPSWGVSDTVIDQMISSLKTCSDNWWEPLPKQGRSRQWLKRIGEATTPAEFNLKRQIEAVMTPYFNFVKTIYPEISAWRVGALRTTAGAPSQYERQADTLHRDYSEEVLSRPSRERPLSIIMALDRFSFFVKPPLPSDSAPFVETMVERGQAVVFTNEQLHSGGPNKEKRMVYRLFAYLVSDEADYPNAEVYPDTKRRQDRMDIARCDDGRRPHLRSSGRSRGQGPK